MSKNLYQKINEARVALQSENLKKSGKNRHLGFKYMELEDFLPNVVRINNALNLASFFSVSESGATLTLVDCEAPESKVEFTSQIAEAKLQGKPSPIQELGSMHTYMRRYLYMLAYEITEPDTANQDNGGSKKVALEVMNDGHKHWQTAIQKVKEGMAIEELRTMYRITDEDYGKLCTQ